MTARPRVAVLGAGIMGTCTALYLARLGCRVDLFDEAPAPLSGASRWNEGKIHLGYLYAASSSLATAQAVLPGGLAFRTRIEELIGRSIDEAIAAEDDLYLVHRGSVVGMETVQTYFESVASLVRDHPEASRYLADARRSCAEPLPRRQLEQLADTAVVAGGFRVRERSVSTTWIADRLVDAVENTSAIQLHLGERVLAVRGPAGRPNRWDVETAVGVHDAFDVVVNALWHGRPAIDRGVGDCLDRERHHRYRVALFVRTRTALPIASAVVSAGPYGDVKNYNGRDFYVSWYPVGLLTSGEAVDHPPVPVLDDPQRSRLAAEIFDALGAILPPVRAIQRSAEQVRVAGGWVYAQARGRLDDPASTLHRRDRLGVKWHGRYASVDTGKYSVAPYLAREIAHAIVHGRGQISG